MNEKRDYKKLLWDRVNDIEPGERKISSKNAETLYEAFNLGKWSTLYNVLSFGVIDVELDDENKGFKLRGIPMRPNAIITNYGDVFEKWFDLNDITDDSAKTMCDALLAVDLQGIADNFRTACNHLDAALRADLIDETIAVKAAHKIIAHFN
ncbi:hypothetical protein LCGC14_2071880 [marine sediment metagenome]|uniref:Uncharacterized protein n=1 Tax=marine sediment metagenome TaxID=412755 RepID=A0A0F9GWJ0_9ZZZZ